MKGLSLRDYTIELAREVLEKLGKPTNRYLFPLESKDNEFLGYKDCHIEVLGAKNTKALHVEIFPPLAPELANPIIYIDDEGNCYRSHGESIYFLLYAERLLNKVKRTPLYDWMRVKEEQIDEMVKKKEG